MTTQVFSGRKTIAVIVVAIIFLLIQSYCLGQDSIKSKRVLVVKALTLKNGQPDSVETIFRAGNQVKIVDTNGRAMIKKITAITDSTVDFKNKKIAIGQIKNICLARGIKLTTVGGSVAGGFGIALIGFRLFIPQSSNVRDNIGTAVMWTILTVANIAGLIVSIIPTAVGISRMALTKHYEIGKKWKLVSMPDDSVLKTHNPPPY